MVTAIRSSQSSVTLQAAIGQRCRAHLIRLAATSNEIAVNTQADKVLLVVVTVEDSGSSAGLGVPEAQGAVSGG